jgi:hypothetical protein
MRIAKDSSDGQWALAAAGTIDHYLFAAAFFAGPTVDDHDKALFLEVLLRYLSCCGLSTDLGSGLR